MRGTMRQLGLTSTLLGLMLCASCTTVSVAGPGQRLCSRYTDLFLDPTAHAAAPATAASKDWVNFGVAEAGKLEMANHDKGLAKQVLHMCEQEGVDATERAKHDVKPWYRKLF